MHRHLCLGLVLLGSAGKLTAQTASAWHDSTERAYTAMRALHDSMLQADSGTTEVTRRGNVVIAASSNEAANATAALGRFIAVRTQRYGSGSPGNAGFRIVVRTDHAATSHTAGVGAEGSVVIAELPDSAPAMRVRANGRSANVADDLLDQFGKLMMASVPTLGSWIGDGPPLSMGEGQRRDEVMYAFVTASSTAARRCVAGDVSACERALQMRPARADSMRALSPFVRADLLYFALRAGGADAWHRLSSTGDSSVAGILAAASQLPTDSLVARWRADVLQRRPNVATISTPAACIALLWTALLVTAALGASKWA